MRVEEFGLEIGLARSIEIRERPAKMAANFFLPFSISSLFFPFPPFKCYFSSLLGIWQQAGTRLPKWGVPSPGRVFCPLLVATEGIVTKLWLQGSGVLGPFSSFSEP